MPFCERTRGCWREDEEATHAVRLAATLRACCEPETGEARRDLNPSCVSETLQSLRVPFSPNLPNLRVLFTPNLLVLLPRALLRQAYCVVGPCVGLSGLFASLCVCAACETGPLVLSVRATALKVLMLLLLRRVATTWLSVDVCTRLLRVTVGYEGLRASFPTAANHPDPKKISYGYVCHKVCAHTRCSFSILTVVTAFQTEGREEGSGMQVAHMLRSKQQHWTKHALPIRKSNYMGAPGVAGSRDPRNSY